MRSGAFVGASGSARRPGASPFAFTVALGAVIALATLVVWVATGGYFWPAWVVLGWLTVLAPFVWWRHLGGRPNSPRTRVWWHVDVSVTVAALVVTIWLLSGARGPWVVWPVLALATLLALHALIDLRDDVPQLRRRELQERVDALSRTRRQAIDAQAAELRRIERDLHDGAQARLVALAMQLGRAEAELLPRSKAAELVGAARAEATLAIQELRDLARGIAPPVLTDRGLVAAARSLVDRGPATLTVLGDGRRRMPPAVESAAYFFLAEALTNAAKHSVGAAAQVTLTLGATALIVEVVDEGAGGADPAGSGLQGLRARVEALDGSMTLTSPQGGPTRLRAELPCE